MGYLFAFRSFDLDKTVAINALNRNFLDEGLGYVKTINEFIEMALFAVATKELEYARAKSHIIIDEFELMTAEFGASQCKIKAH